jgi:nucleoside phosphorylase
MPPPHEYTEADYQIGIICALDIEAAAMTSMLDETHIFLSKDVADPTLYTFGRIGEHNVVVGCFPAGLIGNGPAAMAAINMQRRFSIKIGLIVGIGGGVWSEEHDIRLGDVVVSQPIDTHGSVIQWDYGKVESEGEFQRKDSLNKPPSVLRHALQDLKTYARINGLDIHSALEIMGKNDLRMFEMCKYQGADNDKLFRSTYNHESGDTCAGCDPSSIEQRPARKSLRPRVHYGNIASGNQVIKDGITRDRIAKNGNVICFETEAAGLINDFPCLLIRGICDYADSHRNKIWLPYAAATAAAFTRILLGFISKQELIDTTSMQVIPFIATTS